MEETKKTKAKMKEEKRKKFHAALLHFYHPHPHAGPTSPPPPPQANFDEALPTLDLEYDPVSADEVEKENCVGGSTDCEPKKLTRAQRKRVRERKLKEAASVRRNIVGPLFPSGYQVSQEEHSDGKVSEEAHIFKNDPVGANQAEEEENCVGDAIDCEPKKFTSAQRKRGRKRKLKGADSVQRKNVGPLFPSGYQEHSHDRVKSSQEDYHTHMHDPT